MDIHDIATPHRIPLIHFCYTKAQYINQRTPNTLVFIMNSEVTVHHDVWLVYPLYVTVFYTISGHRLICEREMIFNTAIMSLHLKHYLDNQICHKGFKNYLHVYLNLLSLLTGLFDNILLMFFSLVRILYNQCFTSNYFILPTLAIMICFSYKLLVHLVFPYPYLIIIYNDHL